MKKINFVNGTTIDGAKAFNGIQDNVEDVFNGNESMGSIVVEDISCKNLFDKNKVTQNKYISSEGQITEQDGVSYSDFIKVKPNTIYYVGDRGIWESVALYDNTKTYIERVSVGQGYYIIPNNTHYIIFNIENSKIDTFEFKKKDFNNLQHYSTEEQIIGTWINDKPIYRKVINFGALPNASEKSVIHNISNLDTITNGFATIKNTTYNSHFILPLVSITANKENISWFISSTNIIISCGSDRSAFKQCYVTLEYTKTTD